MAENVLYYLAAAMPFLVCLFWTVSLILENSTGRGQGRPGKVFLAFVSVSTLLYACHFLHFAVENPDIIGIADSVWVFCNLSVYPLFTIWIARLTSVSRPRVHWALMLLPAIVCSLLSFLLGFLGKDQWALLLCVKIIFSIEVVFTLVFGVVRLREFRRTVANFYADTEGRELRSVGLMLTLLLATSAISFVANLIGRDAFYGSSLLLVPSVIFSALLYSICYIGHLPVFDSASFQKEIINEKEEPEEVQEESAENSFRMEQLMKAIVAVMENDRLYLQHGLKITDLAAAVGSNRTYVSNCINKNMGTTFSDYVSSYRIKAAIALLEEAPEAFNIETVGWKSGFSSRSQFWRSFKKETGMSPSEWLEKR